VNLKHLLVVMVGSIAVSVANLSADQTLQKQTPELNLVICDGAALDAETTLIAGNIVAGVFEKAAVGIHWIEASMDLCSSPAHDYLTVVIVSQAPRGTKPDTMGTAPVRTGPHPRAYVYNNLVKRFVSNFRTPNEKRAAGVVLGYAISHEVGHLLIS